MLDKIDTLDTKKNKKGKIKNVQLSDNTVKFLFLVPGLIIIIGILLFPLIDAIRVSFTDLSLFGMTGKFVGFKNYISIFRSKTYQIVLFNTLVISGVSVALEFIIGLGLAILLNRKFRASSFIRGLIIIPWLVPFVVVGVLWKWMLDTDIGIVNYLLTSLKLVSTSLPWISNSLLSKISVILAFVWTGTPFIMIVMLAGLQSIPQEIGEAAAIDGAGRLAVFRFITLPYLYSLIAIVILLSTVYIFQNFAVIYMLTGGGPGNATEILSLHVYNTAFHTGQLGKACAIGVTWMLLSLVFSALYVRFTIRDES